MEWLEDLELTCELCKITKVEQVLPVRLKGVARGTYWQLSKEQWDDVKEVKRALIKAYTMDSFVALKQFTTTSTGNGLPSHVRGLLQLSTSLETLTLREVDERACSVSVDTSDEHLAAAAQPEQTSHTPSIHKTGLSDVTCFRCGSLNHLAKDCMQCCSF